MTLSEIRASRPWFERLRDLAVRRCEGGALVELGVTLPIIFLLMTGIFAFSVALYQKLALAQGIGAGATYIARDRGVDTDPCKVTASQIAAAAPTLSTTSMKLTFVVNGATLVNNVAAASASCSGTTLPKNDSVEVTGTYPCSINMYGLKFSSCTLSTAMTEQIQ